MTLRLKRLATVMIVGAGLIGPAWWLFGEQAALVVAGIAVAAYLAFMLSLVWAL